LLFQIIYVKGSSFLYGLGEAEAEGRERTGSTSLTTTERGLFKLKWEQNPFNVPKGLDRNFSSLQTVLTTPMYEKEISKQPDQKQNEDDGSLKPKNFSVLKLQEFGLMENGQVDFSQGPLMLRLRWSPEMLAAGSIYALLKIQNVFHSINEPADIEDIKKLLYRIDDPSYIFLTSVRTSQAFRWVLQRAKSLSYAFWYYRKAQKYAPETVIQSYAEHRELTTSLKRFLGDEEAKNTATDIIKIFKRRRYPMEPIHTLQIIKNQVTRALKSSGDSLDVVRYECTINPSSSGATLGSSNFTINCSSQDIDDPP
jgi:hypothetical protein